MTQIEGGTSSQNNGDSQYYSNMKMQSNMNNIESDQRKTRLLVYKQFLQMFGFNSFAPNEKRTCIRTYT